ncbi:MAG: DUF423 domain-containing protein [Halofilum sp. (in: g-proteobacteria)]
MIRWAFIAAGLSGLLAVALGAFGAHALRDILDADMRAVFDTAGRYHFFHTLALLLAALAPVAGLPRRVLVVACAAWIAGIIVFSGSLYLLAVTGFGWLGAITPVGGVAFLLGWVAIAVGGWRAAASGRDG